MKRLLGVLAALALALAAAEPIPAQALDLVEAEIELSACENAERGSELLMAIAAYYTAEDPNPMVVEICANALRHPLQRVRCEAAVILGARVAAEDGVPELLRSLDQLEDEKENIAKRAAKAKVTPKSDDMAEQMDALAANWGRLEKLIKDRERVFDFQMAILTGLMQHKDPRCIEAVASCLPDYVYTDVYATFTDYLLDCRTQASIRGVVDAFKECDRIAALRSKGRKKVTGARSPRRPKGYRGTAAEWRAHTKKTKDDSIQRYDSETAAMEAKAQRFCDHVRKFASRNGLTSVPKTSRATGWQSWWKRNKKNFPTGEESEPVK